MSYRGGRCGLLCLGTEVVETGLQKRQLLGGWVGGHELRCSTGTYDRCRAIEGPEVPRRQHQGFGFLELLEALLVPSIDLGLSC